MECIFTAYFNWYPVCLIYFLFQQGTMECILTAALTGVLFALFSGQPLNILGSTGPMLVLEMIIYNLCQYVYFIHLIKIIYEKKV
jgi:hypothetical protein